MVGRPGRTGGKGMVNTALPSPIVLLVDVDDTLLENDRIQDDFQAHMGREFGPECRDRFWAIQEELFQELGYRDYLGAFQRFRVEHPYEPHLVTAANYLVDYPFADRLYPRRTGRAQEAPHLGANGDSLRRRRGLSAAQGRSLRHLQSRRGSRADLRA